MGQLAIIEVRILASHRQGRQRPYPDGSGGPEKDSPELKEVHTPLEGTEKDSQLEALFRKYSITS